MNKFRRKSEVVTSVQWWKPGDHPDIVIHPSYPNERGLLKHDFSGPPIVGACMVDRGDWIIEHADGRIEVINPELFAATYEAVDE